MREEASSRIGVLLSTLGGNLFIVLGSIVFGTLAILFSWLPPRGRWVFLMARWWSRGLLVASGLKISARGARLESGKCYVFMPNHQSLYDIPALIATLPVTAFFFAKRSLFRIPIFGWAIRAGGFVSIDRSDRSQAKKGFAQAVNNLESGLSTVIFPEGTRSLDGELLPFERGGFLLAIKSRADIVPVGIRGTLAVRRRDSMKIRPGRIEIHYGNPVAIADYDVRTRGQLESIVRQQIAALMGPTDNGES